MQITVTFLSCQPKRTFIQENLECRFRFSVIDTSLIGTPHDLPSIHTTTIVITDELMNHWRLEGAFNNGVSDDMLKVAFQIAEEYITEQLKRGDLQEKVLPRRALSTKNTQLTLPYNLANIPYPGQTSFAVDVEGEDFQSLNQCLEDFSYYVSAEKRMKFWRVGTDKERKWIAHPEAHAKDLLQTFLRGRYGDSIYQFEEIAAGAGRVDIFIIWSHLSERVVVELKLCGHGYSLNYANEGREQLIHYMKNKKAHTGYLVVFDSRSRDFSEGLPAREEIGEIEISAILVDVRPYVKQRDTPVNA